MPPPSSVVHLTIALPGSHHAAYAEAIRLLVRVMGKRAPDLLSLVVHTLRCRDSRGLADDYLESIAWPVKRREISAGKNRRIDSARRRRSSRRLAEMNPEMGDPVRN